MNPSHRSMRMNEPAVGEYYVNSECAGCGLCLEIAPTNFSMNEDEGHSFVSRQPATPEDKPHCQEAMAWCPADAIGDDGLEMRPVQYLEITPRLMAVH